MTFDRELQQARDEGRFARIACEEFETEVVGLVHDLSAEFVSLSILDDRVRMGGVDVMRRANISEVEMPAPHVDFYESALRLRGETLPEADALDLGSMQGVIESVAKISPLIVIHRETIEPDVCEIGKLVAADAKGFQLLEIDPDADWYDDPTSLSYADVTRVGYGGDYEAALALVAGIVS